MPFAMRISPSSLRFAIDNSITRETASFFRQLGLVCVVAVLASSAGTAAAASVSFAAIGDTYVEQQNPSTNYGSSAQLTVKNDATSKRRPYLRFDLSSVPAGSVITSARLGVWLTDNTIDADGDTLTLYGINNGTTRENFVEGNGGTDGFPAGELTWNLAPFTTNFPAGTAANTVRHLGTHNLVPTTPVGTQLSFDGANLVDFLSDSMGAGKDQLASFVLANSNTADTRFFRLASREFTPAGEMLGAWAPRLVVEFEPSGAPETVVSYGATWRYFTGASGPGTGWHDPEYSDASWPTGVAQLGYGDGDEATTVTCGSSSPQCTSGNWATTYFRRTFTIEDASLIKSVLGEVIRDDAAAVYVNGVELFRDLNLSPTAAAGTFASGTGAENGKIGFLVDRALLLNGENVIAVEIHQAGATSSDMSFDLQLVAYAVPEPSSYLLMIVGAAFLCSRGFYRCGTT